MSLVTPLSRRGGRKFLSQQDRVSSSLSQSNDQRVLYTSFKLTYRPPPSHLVVLSLSKGISRCILKDAWWELKKMLKRALLVWFSHFTTWPNHLAKLTNGSVICLSHWGKCPSHLAKLTRGWVICLRLRVKLPRVLVICLSRRGKLTRGPCICLSEWGKFTRSVRTPIIDRSLTPHH